MKNILVPIDFTDASRSASSYAASIAKLFTAKIHLLHVYLQPSPAAEDSSAWVIVDDSLQKAKEALINKEIDHLKEAHGVDASGEVDMGNSGDSIIDTAKKIQADLIVMGMKKDRSFQIFGSATLVAIRKSKLPVLVVPEGVNFHPIKNMVLAADFRGIEDESCFNVLFLLAEKFAANLHLVHVQKNGQVMTGDDVPGRVQLDRTFSRVPSFTYEEIADEEVNEGILHYIDKRPADLLIMIARHHHVLERLLGKVHTRSIACSIRIPMLVLEDK